MCRNCFGGPLFATLQDVHEVHDEHVWTYWDHLHGMLPKPEVVSNPFAIHDQHVWVYQGFLVYLNWHNLQEQRKRETVQGDNSQGAAAEDDSIA